MTFQDLKLIPPILKALAQENYTQPTPIQEQAIPPALAGRDLFGAAQTGTGKTAAFSLPIIQRLSEQQVGGGKRVIRALILTPTRELAIQISDNIKAYGRHVNLRSAVIVGGVSQRAQEQDLQRGTDILIATPGRLIDLMNQGFADLRHVQILVLDEADRMLDMGFIHDMKRIIAKLPAQRQTLFFSATMPPEIQSLVDSLLKNPVKIEITPVSTTAERIEQSLYYVDKPNKLSLLIDLLQQNKAIESAIVFTRTKHGADRVARGLVKAKIPAQAIHGDKSQNARQAALANFKNGATRVLVATDIAARGIDIDELSHVINYNLPNIPETYVHRIGRTGRAGLSGTAISFCEYEEVPYLKDIEKLTKQKIPVVEDHPYPMVMTEPAPKAPNGGGRGGNAGGGGQGRGQGGNAGGGQGRGGIGGNSGAPRGGQSRGQGGNIGGGQDGQGRSQAGGGRSSGAPRGDGGGNRQARPQGAGGGNRGQGGAPGGQQRRQPTNAGK